MQPGLYRVLLFKDFIFVKIIYNEMIKILYLAIILSFVLFLAININSPIKIQGDGVFYYSWLRSALWDRDFDFKNELEYYADYDVGSKWFLDNSVVTPTGKIPNAYAYGAGLMWLPFVLLAHLVTWLLSLFDPQVVISGYTYFYVLAINFATWLYGVLSVLMIYQIIKKVFDQKVAVLTTLGIWLASSIIYYQFLESSMSHIGSLFLVTSFFCLIIRAWRQEKYYPWLLSVVIFLMIATRWQNVIFLMAYLPILWRHRQDMMILMRKALVATVPVVVFVLSQLLIWKNIYGQYLLVPQGEGFVRFEFHGLYTLLSSNRGLLLWSPIFILAVVGWFYLSKKSKFLAGITLAVFVGQWIINSSLNDLGGGDAYGARRFIETLPFLALALASLLAKIDRRAIMTVVILIFILCNLVLIENYRLGIIPHAGEFKFWQVNYFQVIGRDIDRFISR
ncbi:MAG TPA: hypothetical protein VJB67_00225 [Patescibacteria group bacterium]|nr:hypothetical protein [Patescibacteria group bacterium]